MSSKRDVVFSPAGITNHACSVEEVDDAAFQHSQAKLRVDSGAYGDDRLPVGMDTNIQFSGTDAPVQKSIRNRWTPYLVYCCIASVIGSSFMFGYNAVVINLPADTLRSFINDSYYETRGSALDKDAVDDLFTWTVSLFLIGGMIGGLIGGSESDKLGRKRGLLFNAVIGVISGILMFVAPYANIFELMMVGRFIAGIHCGSVTAIVPACLTELAPLSLRGAAGSMNQFSIVIGGFSACVLGLPVICGQNNPNIWPFMFFPCILLPALQIVLLIFTVETPRWLVAIKRDEAGALASVKRLREKEFSRDILESEITVLRQERESQEALPRLSFVEAFVGCMGWPLFVCLLMQVSQQLSGINAVIYYSTDVLKTILENETAQYASLGIIGFTVLMTFISVNLVERLGRRPLMIAGLGSMWIDCILIVVSMKYKEITAFNYVTVVCFFVFVGMFNIGPGPIPWFIAPEVTQPQYRPMTIALCTFTNWAANLATGLGYPPIQKAIGALSFLPFLGLLTIFVVCTVLFLPETRNIPVEENIRNLQQHRIQLRCGGSRAQRQALSPSASSGNNAL